MGCTGQGLEDSGPNDPAIKGRIMENIHAMTYASHLEYQKTLKQSQKNFYWPDLTIEVRDYMLGCQACQKEKSVSRVPKDLQNRLHCPNTNGLMWL